MLSGSALTERRSNWPPTLDALLLGVCSGQPTSAQTGSDGCIDMKTLSGEIWCRERALLQPGHQITVTLQGVSEVDGVAEVPATSTFPAAGAPPFPFWLSYDASRVDEHHTQAVSARIERDGVLRFVSDTRYPAFSDTPPTIMVVAVPQARPAVSALPLNDSYWQLQKVRGAPALPGAGGNPADISVADGRVAGFAGCNRYSADYQSACWQ